MITFGSEASDINVYQVDKRTGCHSEAAVLHTYLFNFGTWPYRCARGRQKTSTS